MADRIKNYQQEADQITTLKAIRTDLGVTPSSYTPDATVVTKDRVVTFAQAEEELVVLSDIEKGAKQQVTEVDIAQKDIANIKALLQGHLYDYQTDSTSAYTKSVPSGAMPYAGLEKVGGKTLVFNQLVSAIESGKWARQNTSATNLTFADGVATTQVTTAGLAYWQYKTILVYSYRLTPIVGHKYYVSIDTISTCNLRLSLSTVFGQDVAISASASYIHSSAIGTATSATLPDMGVGPNSDVSVTTSDTFSFKNYMCIDLTLMFGAGNEPSTVEEFESMLPASYYAYNAGTLLSAGVTSVVSKDGNNATLQTYSVPAEVQALEGYGWSCPDHYNYIDYEAKKFVQEVGSRTYASGDESDSTVITDGTTTYYPLTTAVETDISEYLTDDNLIQVESGGTLAFQNSNGDDYRLPVPSEETYMIDLQEAINNG